jgi:hypothetical protein
LKTSQWAFSFEETDLNIIIGLAFYNIFILNVSETNLHSGASFLSCFSISESKTLFFEILLSKRQLAN